MLLCISNVHEKKTSRFHRKMPKIFLNSSRRNIIRKRKDTNNVSFIYDMNRSQCTPFISIHGQTKNMHVLYMSTYFVPQTINSVSFHFICNRFFFLFVLCPASSLLHFFKRTEKIIGNCPNTIRSGRLSHFNLQFKCTSRVIA